MATDQEIAEGVETVLSQADPNAVTSLNGVVQQLQAKFGLDLSHKALFIRDQITLTLRSNPISKEHFPLYFPNTLLPHPNIAPAHPENAAETKKTNTSSGNKRKGGAGGLNKVCGVSPELQAIVGEPALPRTEIVKQLWAYIKKHNLQDPSNKRKIICDDALRLVLEIDCTDMFKMNKLLAKHIISLDPTKQSNQAKKLKVDDEFAKECINSSPSNVVISDALAKFFETGEREMIQSKAVGRVWEYIKANKLEDPLNPMIIHCDVKLQEILGCERISALGIQEMLVSHHLFK